MLLTHATKQITIWQEKIAELSHYLEIGSGIKSRRKKIWIYWAQPDYCPQLVLIRHIDHYAKNIPPLNANKHKFLDKKDNENAIEV